VSSALTASGPEARDRAARSRDFGLLGDLESIVDLDTEIPHGALELQMASEQLLRS